MIKILILSLLVLGSYRTSFAKTEEDSEHMPPPTPASKDAVVPFLATYIPATERPTLPESTPVPTEVVVGYTPDKEPTIKPTAGLRIVPPTPRPTVEYIEQYVAPTVEPTVEPTKEQ